MPFTIVRNDIANICADAIVNTANPMPVVGPGTDTAIHAKAGEALLKAREKIGPLAVGTAAVTEAYGLAADYVIHTVGPVWQGGAQGEEQLLRRCYDSALSLALEKDCSSVAFPLISAGHYGFPKALAMQIAKQAFSAFLSEHEMQIYLVVWNRDAFELSEKLLGAVESYIDENYIAEKEIKLRQYRPSRREERFFAAGSNCLGRFEEPCVASRPAPMAAAPAPSAAPNLDELLAKTDAGFTATLLKLIDESGKKDSEIYKKANVSKQHFSKIRSNLSYRPSKATAVAFAIALELNLEQTRDLIGRAGYALTNSSRFDVIIQYFIREKNYNMFDINMTLFKYDEMTLGV